MSSGRSARIVDTIIVTVLALAIALGVGRALVHWFGYPVVVITGSSMGPAIPLGAAVVLTPVASGRIAVGDVVTFQRPDHRPTTHRVVAVQELTDDVYLTLKGDANPVPDPSAIPASWVTGRVAQVVPALGYVLAFLSLPTGWLSLLSGLLSLWLARRLLDEFVPRQEVAPRGRPVAVAGLIALMATAALLGGATAQTAGAWFTDSAAVSSNSFTTGTWGP
jgi:signal peptidase I